MEKRLTSTWHGIRKNHPIYNLYTSSWGNPVVSAMIWPAILPYHLPLSDLGNFRDAQMQFVSAVYLVRWFLDIPGSYPRRFWQQHQKPQSCRQFCWKTRLLAIKIVFFKPSQIVSIAKKTCLFWGCICRQDRIGFWWLRLTWSNSP